MTRSRPQPRAREHYSGHASRKFWSRINRTKDMALYGLGCDLQDLEGKVLQRLRELEKSKKP